MHDAEIELLVLAFQEGKRDAFAFLYRHFYPGMRRFAAARLPDANLADDLVQNVWLKVNQRIRALDDPRVFRSWLYRALRWELLDWHKAKGNQPHAELTDELTDQHSATPSAVAEPPALLPLLQQLAKTERDVVELYYLHELSVHETALVLQLPEGTVKSRLHRARQQLKALYPDDN
ncbi:RNA polymerase sigma factor [Alkalimonas amylolytica]|uniref:RNA polymerase sigma-70 factor, ECF subfamily n=1 Tax=Alkalimonas amylolytica TaxID=152573 RepID=A0A1H3Y8Z0_ALKAM|nr:sigma-70 family RNA polymerase sigma factor [Alkalimonas amylolytica]SEA07414.1 RNA polymerase sigma-70 factor, ECF subfamily [Alkalimonas amylolytica]